MKLVRFNVDLRKAGVSAAAKRGLYVAEADKLLRKSVFTKEDGARFNALLTMSRELSGIEVLPETNPDHLADFRDYLLNRKIDRRDMSVGSNALGGFLVPASFTANVISAMKAYDRLTDENVITVAETDHGEAWSYPMSDDTSSAATKLAEGVQDNEVDTTLGQLSFNIADSWRTGIVKVSRQLFQDSGIAIEDFLALVFGIRLARGMGSDLRAAMMAGATLGRTAVGSATNTGGVETGATTIGTDDLFALMGSIDAAYVGSSSCGWAMTWASLVNLWGVKDKQGRPIIKPEMNEAGDFVVHSRPVFISPSMDAIATTKKPIAFGAMDYIVQRVVKNSLRIIPFSERFAEYGQFAWGGYMLANSAFAKPAAESPVKFLQNA